MTITIKGSPECLILTDSSHGINIDVITQPIILSAVCGIVVVNKKGKTTPVIITVNHIRIVLGTTA